MERRIKRNSGALGEGPRGRNRRQHHGDADGTRPSGHTYDRVPLGRRARCVALLVTKLHKLAEREPEPGRWSSKDGLDVLRILQSADLTVLGATLAGLEHHTLAGPITGEARQ